MSKKTSSFFLKLQKGAKVTKSIISDPSKYIIGKSGAYYNPKYFEVIEGKIYLKNSKDPKELDDLAYFKEK